MCSWTRGCVLRKEACTCEGRCVIAVVVLSWTKEACYCSVLEGGDVFLGGDCVSLCERYVIVEGVSSGREHVLL